jgi:outer membrane protein
MINHKKKLSMILLITCIVTLALGTGLCQAAPATNAIGYVDYLYLINNHPDTPKANEELKAVQEQLKKEFENKSASLADKEKRELALQLDQQIEQKRQELLKPITEKIVVAVKAVRVEKGLSVVLGRNVIVDGGVDITADVMNKFTGK